MDIARLDDAVRFYCDRGLAESTQRTYRCGINRYLSFCFAFNVTSPFPVSEARLCYFVAMLAGQGVSPTTIKTYLAAVRHAQIIRGHPEPRQLSSLPRLRLIQNGVRRERARTGPASATRLPITPAILRQIRPHILSPPLHHDALMLWAAATCCFFGFFRAGEITVPAASAFDAAVHLAWGDVAISEDNQWVVRVFLKRSKTDQFGRGVAVFLGVTGDVLCPVAAIQAYATSRGDSPGAFFRSVDGTPLTKAHFVARFREALSMAGVRVGGYSGHSFRIGAATTAAQAGVPDSVIQALGRWTSSAFLRYIRTPSGQLAQHTQSLSRSN